MVPRLLFAAVMLCALGARPAPARHGSAPRAVSRVIPGPASAAATAR